jgi:SAM-dependent MidA family methyltransferase
MSYTFADRVSDARASVTPSEWAATRDHFLQNIDALALTNEVFDASPVLLDLISKRDAEKIGRVMLAIADEWAAGVADVECFSEHARDRVDAEAAARRALA